MSLSRQLRRRGAHLLRDPGLLAALRAEIDHELSSAPLGTFESDLEATRNEVVVEGFTLEPTSLRAQDVLLRRKPVLEEEEEEVVVSALLAPLQFQNDQPLTRSVRMRVFVRTPGREPLLHFNCKVFNRQKEESNSHFGTNFAIKNVLYHPSIDLSSKDKYRGPRFNSLEPQLQNGWKEYLIARGVTPKLTNFIFEHLHRKEHNQYVKWLDTLESIIAKTI